jgi:uncharacterized C2H2 Zn-finger protein
LAIFKQLPEEFLKCPGCECVFLTMPDLQMHINKFGNDDHEKALNKYHMLLDIVGYDKAEFDKDGWMWKKSQFGGDEEICLAEHNPKLHHMCLCNETVRAGLYKYRLNKTKKWIIRTKCGV